MISLTIIALAAVALGTVSFPAWIASALEPGYLILLGAGLLKAGAFVRRPAGRVRSEPATESWQGRVPESSVTAV